MKLYRTYLENLNLKDLYWNRITLWSRLIAWQQNCVLFLMCQAKHQTIHLLMITLILVPHYNTDLPTILQNWRSYKYVFTADIKKMYWQILAHFEDVWRQCILWRDSPQLPIMKYGLLIVTYSTRPVPFWALRVFIQLCEDEGVNFPLAVLILLFENFIDDILSGAHDWLTALQRRDQFFGLLDRTKAHKWSNNTPELLEGISPNDQGFIWTSSLNGADTIKVLCITWNPISNSFFNKISVEPLTKITKCTVLSLILELFNSTSWISPIIVVGKIFMQDMWHYNYRFSYNACSIVTHWDLSCFEWEDPTMNYSNPYLCS